MAVMHSALTSVGSMMPTERSGASVAWTYRLKKIGTKVLSALLFPALLTASAWGYDFKQPYSHYSEREDVRAVLVDFARSQGMSAQVSPELSGVISGRFDAVDPATFLGGLYQAYGVQYYVLGKTIYFYGENERTQSLFKPSALNANELLQALNDAHLISPDLPLHVNPQGLLVLAGPPTYVTGLLTVAQEFDATPEHEVVMKVIKLTHAKAQDITVNSMDSQVVIPGIASILQRMVAGSSYEGSGTMTVTTQSARQTTLRGLGLAASGTPTTNSVQGTDGSTVSASGAADNDNNSGIAPNILADSRLNAVIIQDYQFRIPYYEQVISELDVPLELIELHAAIVDVDVGATNSLGIDWNAGRRDGNWGVGIGSGNVNWDGSLPASNSRGGGLISTVFNSTHSSFMAQVNLLEEDNKATTLGKPSVLTFDNTEATLEDTTTRYIPVRGYESSDLFKVESGTVLRVTPHIVEDPQGGPPYIQMVINLQSNQDDSSSLDSIMDADGNVVVPPIKQTKINTQAIVRQGQSLLLGGYYVQYEMNEDSGVPVIKDAPGVGKLFGSEGSDTYTRERLLIITPRIVDPNELNVPTHARDLNFDKTPIQSDYEKHTPAPLPQEESSGCSSTRNRMGTAQSAATPLSAPNGTPVSVPSGTQSGAQPGAQAGSPVVEVAAAQPHQQLTVPDPNSLNPIAGDANTALPQQAIPVFVPMPKSAEALNHSVHEGAL